VTTHCRSAALAKRNALPMEGSATFTCCLCLSWFSRCPKRRVGVALRYRACKQSVVRWLGRQYSDSSGPAGHAPQYLIPGWAAQNGGFTLSGISVFTLSVISVSIIYTWVSNGTKGSLLIAILLHTAMNFSQGLTSDLFPAAKFNETGPVIAFALTAVVIVAATRACLGLTNPQVNRESTRAEVA
jgi:hypothetical protein